MNKVFKYGAVCACLFLIGAQSAYAESGEPDGDLYVTPSLVQIIPQEDENASEAADESKNRESDLDDKIKEDSSEKAASAKIVQDELQKEAAVPENKDNSAVLEAAEKKSEETQPSVSADMQKTEIKPGTSKIDADFGGRSENFSVIIPKYQPLAALYADLVIHNSGEALDKSLVKSLEKLAADSSYEEDLYILSLRAHVKAKGALAAGKNKLGEALKKSAEEDLSFTAEWLKNYGRRVTVHGKLEPEWIGEADAAAQIILAYCDLNSFHPEDEYVDRIDKIAKGLMMLLHAEAHRYPFGAHLSYVTSEGKPRTYTVPATGENVAGAIFFPDRLYSAMALASASKLLKNSDMMASAEAEGLGILAKLALSGKIPYSYSPRPEVEVRSILGPAAVTENLMFLKAASGNNLYGTLAGCAAVNIKKYSSQPDFNKFKNFTDTLLRRGNCQDWVDAEDLCAPFAGTSCGLENGKAVEKAFDAHDIKYPGGTDGKFVVVGRDNMFWIRFDVDREDSYYFYLDFLKSNFSGALVSIMARIDGDKIFKVSLGGATDDPFVDNELIDGPRTLRSGPHSLGIRFSGLLMKSPAVLGSVSVEPAVGRRWVKLSSGRSLLVMHSIADRAVKTRMQELENENSSLDIGWSVFEAGGKPALKNLSSDKRRHVWFEMPANGTAVLEWPEGTVPDIPLN